MMTQEQLNQLKFNYCEQIIDSMDINDLMCMCHDLLMDSYANCTEEQMKEEVEDLYSEDMWEELTEGIK